MDINAKRDIVRISGDKIDLCVIRRDDEALTKYTKWMNDASINHWLGRSREVFQIKDEAEWMDKKKDGMFFNIVEKGTRELVGNCEICPISGTRNASLGILIGEEKARDKGFGTEAIKLLVKFGFEEINAHRIFLNAKANNIRAIKCYEKAGFKQCAIFHETDYWHGKYWDSIQMEILEQDYYASKAREKEH